jgi:hypothetical protein
MPAKVNLFERLSKMPPDELADLCGRIKDERPRTAAIMADVLAHAVRPNPAPFVPKFTPPAAVVEQAEPKRHNIRSVSRDDSELTASGQPPEGLELPPEFYADEGV